MATGAIAVTGQIDPATLGRSELLPAFLPIILPFAILLLPLADFTLAVLRRLRAGKSPFTADRKHLHHRLLDMGHSHLQAVLILYSWTTVVSVGFLLFFIAKPYGFAVAFLVVGAILCTFLTLAPLTRRQRMEQSVQGTPGEDVFSEFDPLDAASNSLTSDMTPYNEKEIK
jgi:UDP-GlcNAc:undecaprenyl-phosphate GlcNAc-1-phosphate transferase